jgi:hypothetical protein
VGKRGLKISFVLKNISTFAVNIFNLKTKKIMKKLFAVFALVAVMTSCKDKKKDAKAPDATTTTTTTDPNSTTTTTTTTTSSSGVPTFADAEVQKFVNDYTAFVNAYMDAYKGKDMTKVAELAGNYQQWAGQVMTISQKLAANPDDAKKFSDYMSKLSLDWANAAKAMMPTN